MPTSDAARRRPRSIDWAALEKAARRRFGIRKFRPGQRELIECALRGRDALGILPTGAGKSLCYQLPSLYLKGAVVVVSPLIALMQDQYEHLAEADIPAARLDSSVPEGEQRELEEGVTEGDHDIVLVTPERLTRAEHIEPLKERGVALFVVDEAHCVSQWGHHFRPAYLELRHAIRELGSPPVLALTATAPPDRIDDILGALGIEDATVIQGSVDRESLSFSVVRTVNREEKEARLLGLLQSEPGSVIVYAATVRTVNELHAWLKSREMEANRYHGSMSARDRERSQREFMDGEVRVIVATNAFGLGVDKPDVRAVVHWNFPDSIESYYQEAGRAGRDGQPARCVLFYQVEDKRIRSFFNGGKHPRRDEVMRFINALRAQSGTLEGLARESGLSERRARVISAGLEAVNVVVRTSSGRRLRREMNDAELEEFLGSFERHQHSDTARLDAMVRYAESIQCRARFIREYFGEPRGSECGRCDACIDPVAVPGAVVPEIQEPRAESSRGPETHFGPGEIVVHSRFGKGEVLEVAESDVEVAFERYGKRRVLASYLSSQAARSPAASRQ